MKTRSHCAIHDAEEVVPENCYEVCFECGHVYATAEDVLTEWLKTFGTTKSEPGRPPFCPLCLHDWVTD